VLVAITRPVPRRIDRCELTHLARAPIDFDRAVAQHDAYEAALVRMGCRIERLPDTPELPDSVFVEDTAVVLDDLAVVTRPGAESRRAEVDTVAPLLRQWRQLARISAPGTLDGGDVLVTPERIFVGLSSRTNQEGATQLAAFAEPHGFATTCLRVTGCLHLKSAVTLAATDTLLLNPEWIDPAAFPDFHVLSIDPAEPFAANVLRIGDRVLCASEHPRTRARLEAAGIRTSTVEADELAKAEGGLTCGCLLVSCQL
jgi:dimethylargininase